MRSRREKRLKGQDEDEEGSREGEELELRLERQVDLTSDEDPTYEDGDTGMGDSIGVSVSLGGEISSGGKKSWE
ncbi:hypothetical protein Tco_1504625 [Tanacetum coccineum]